MNPILPGSTIGILGGGQLGRMFALSARRMGYRVHTLAPDTDTPAGQIADVEIHAEYGDLDAVRRFAKAVDVVTFEFENVPSAAAEEAVLHAPVRPGGHVLHTTQNRIREKEFLRRAGIPLAPFEIVNSEPDLLAAIGRIGCPAVLKTAGFGYDGRGQAKILSPADAPDAWRSIGGPAVLEGFIHFKRELSVVAVRGLDGAFAHYGVIENNHSNHILDTSVAPVQDHPEAAEITRSILEQLDVTGVLTVEFFECQDGRLMVNELAPRPHNSGHLTIDAFVTSQFEQQLRAVCGLPLGSTELLRPAAMANLLGDLWEGGEPRWDAVCRFPGVNLHLYGKDAPSRGRKMGHLTALAGAPETALQNVVSARQSVLAARQEFTAAAF